MTAPHYVSHYELLDLLRREDTADIFRARDLRLDRGVAVKLLRREEMSRPGALERFRSEARAASLVTHPHICTIHDWDHDGEHAFLVFELLEGRTLDRLLADNAVGPQRAVDIGIQVADGLAAAHRRGVVHGNLEPKNVFVTADGHVKLLQLGAGAGPLNAYRAPEELTGSAPNERSDVFSAGALLYEMAAGATAFPGTTAAEVAAAIAACAPVRPRRISRAVPRALERIILRALDRAAQNRHAGAGELLDDLRALGRTSSPSRRTPRWRAVGPGVRVRLAWATGLAAIALAGLVNWWWHAPPRSTERSTILIGQIANGTGDPDFDGTLRQATGVYLAQSPYLHLASDDRITATLKMMGRHADAPMTHRVASEVCQRLGLDAMIEGSVSLVAEVTVVALAATDCRTGAAIARQQQEVGEKEQVLAALGRMAGELRPALGESGASLARNNVAIEEATTPSLVALKAYTEAAARRAGGTDVHAIPLLEQAIRIDPGFALAYTTLSSIYGGFGETGRSEHYAKLAYERRGRVSERERLFITYQYHDRVTGDQLQAREALEVWQRTYPRDYRPANALAVLLNRLGEYDAAIGAAQEAMRRNPSHAFPHSTLAYALRGAGQFRQARDVAERAVAQGLATTPLRRLLYQLAELDGAEPLARQQVEWAAKQPRGFDITGARAQVAAFRGSMAVARTLYAATITAATANGFAQVASGYGSQAALTDALYGYERQAIERARAVLDSATAYEPRLRAAAALAIAGQPHEAEAVIRRLREVRRSDTLIRDVYLPVAEAAVHLARRRPEDAFEQLRRAVPYERGTVAAMLPVYLRADARLRAGDAGGAAAEFRSIASSRGADPFSPVVALAWLGLGRAQAAAGDLERSRESYLQLLNTWSAADADLPVLQQARAEFAKLEPPAPAKSSAR